MTAALKYKYSDYSIWLVSLAALAACYLFTWQQPHVNFIDGDAKYYYYYLQSTFVDASLIHADWLDPVNGVIITHHPAGLSILLLPFFLIAYVTAGFLNYPPDGISAPFQVSVSMAAIFYAVVGLIYLKKLLRLNEVPDKISTFVILLIFFGTNLYHYTLSEPAMSHVYSFSLISLFLYYGCNLVKNGGNKNLFYAALVFGFILLVRPNNGLIIFSMLFWFNNKTQAVSFFKKLFSTKAFYMAMSIAALIVLIQPLAWLAKENSFYANRYAAYGFYWLHPQLVNMLFGFDAGFFIYTPLCLLFLFGLISVYKKNRFAFYATGVFILGLFYLFAAYSSYTYYDGLGIRVLVDYYALFGLLGARLFMQLYDYKIAYASVAAVALFFVFINQVYCYQVSNNILLRAGMNYNKWKYVFLKTGSAYQNSLGGSNDLAPFAKVQPPVALSKAFKSEKPFDYSQKDFGLALSFDSLGFDSKRIQLKVNVRRKESFINSSKDALICAMLENKAPYKQKKYGQFKLNETPSETCCDDAEYHYTATMEADFKATDRLSVYVWNINQQPFSIDKFSVQLYNYNYQ